MTRYARAADVAVVDDGERIYAAVLPDGPIHILTDESALVWRAVADGEGTELVAQVRAAGSNDPEADAAAFAGALVDAGLLIVDEEP